MTLHAVVAMLVIFAGVFLVATAKHGPGPSVATRLQLNDEVVDTQANWFGKQIRRRFRTVTLLLRPWLARLAWHGYSEKTSRLIAQAGLSRFLLVEDILLAQLVGAAIMTSFGLLVILVALPSKLGLAALVVCGVFGFLAPRVLLERVATRRVEKIRDHFPDFLDLVTLSVSAGLGFDTALLEVSAQMSGPLAEEGNHLLTAISLGQPREEALAEFAERLLVPEISDFVLAVNHASQMGAVMAPVLSQQTKSARLKHRQMARERINRLPVKILLPTVLFILPATLAIVLGPAVSDIMGMFS